MVEQLSDRILNTRPPVGNQLCVKPRLVMLCHLQICATLSQHCSSLQHDYSNPRANVSTVMMLLCRGIAAFVQLQITPEIEKAAFAQSSKRAACN